MSHLESPKGLAGRRVSALSVALSALDTVLGPFVYPHVAEDFVRTLFPLASSREVLAEIVAVRPETRDTTTLVLRPNGLFRGHRAGQWVSLTAEIKGVRRTRVFSIASAPYTGHAPLDGRGRRPARGTLEITVKARPGGAVTPALVRDMVKGVVVTLSQAEGTFVLPEPLPERPLFVAAGSGITPVMSMLRALADRARAAGATLVYYARTRADVVFARELTELELFAGVRVHVITKDAAGAPHAPRDVRDELPALAPDFASRETFACGPPRLLLSLASLYERRDATARLHVERFSLEPRATPSSRGDGAELDAPEVTFARQGSVQRGARTLLVMAEAAGLSPKSGCRMGICHSCICRKISGTTRDIRTSALSTDADTPVLLCVSEPVGPVVMDL